MRKIPLRIGLKIDPPAVIYIYREAGSLRMRSMPLRNLSDTASVIEDLRNRHGDHIEDVPDFALRKMINIVKQTKQGKSLEEAIKEVNKKTAGGGNSLFDKLRSNIRTSDTESAGRLMKAGHGQQKNANDGFGEDSVFDKLRSNMRTLTNHENSDGAERKKRDLTRKTFGTNLFDEIRIAESKMPSNKAPYSNGSSLDSPERDTSKTQLKHPTSLGLSSFELSTSFNSFRPQETSSAKPRSSFLLDLEREMDELENSKKDDPVKKQKSTNESVGRADGRPQDDPVKKHTSKESNPMQQRNEDDTDVDFDDSDNPLDDPEEDFW